MTGELRYEWRRITTVRSPWICLALAFLSGVAIAWLTADSFDGADSELSRRDWVGAFTAPLMIANVLALVTAAQAIGQEYRFGMIRLTLTAFPRRIPLFTAKAAVAAVWCVGVFVACVLGSWIAVLLHGQPVPAAGLPGGMLGLTVRALLVLLGWAAFGYALAAITRLTPIGITLPIVWGFIIERIVVALMVYNAKQEWVADVAPFQGASSAIDFGNLVADGLGSQGPWAGLGVFWVWAAAFLTLAAVLFERRDA